METHAHLERIIDSQYLSYAFNVKGEDLLQLYIVILSNL